jgi:hypothetical protein
MSASKKKNQNSNSTKSFKNKKANKPSVPYTKKSNKVTISKSEKAISDDSSETKSEVGRSEHYLALSGAITNFFQISKHAKDDLLFEERRGQLDFHARCIGRCRECNVSNVVVDHGLCQTCFFSGCDWAK